MTFKNGMKKLGVAHVTIGLSAGVACGFAEEAAAQVSGDMNTVEESPPEAEAEVGKDPEAEAPPQADPTVAPQTVAEPTVAPQPEPTAAPQPEPAVAADTGAPHDDSSATTRPDLDAYAEPENRANNTLYLELLGPGLLYSFNYERRIADFNLRIGAGGASWEGAGYLQIPVGFNYMGIGSDKHHLELGATVNITRVFGAGESAGIVTFSPIIGYRLQPLGGGFNFRTGLSPFVAGVGEGFVGAGFLPWPYVSFGASF